MARGNPNFKKAQKAEAPAIDQEVKSEVEAFDVTPEPVNPEPVELNDEVILNDFNKLSSDLLAMQKIKLAKNKPSRHYFAISQQVQMWGRNFLRSCDAELQAKVKFGK